MHLQNLSKEKLELFVDLAIYTARVNDKLTEEQQEYISIYFSIIERDNRDFIPKLEIDEVLTKIKSMCTSKEIKSIFIEIIILIMIDGKYDNYEQDFLKEIQDYFEVSNELIGQMFKGVVELVEAYDILKEIIEN